MKRALVLIAVCGYASAVGVGPRQRRRDHLEQGDLAARARQVRLMPSSRRHGVPVADLPGRAAACHGHQGRRCSRDRMPPWGAVKGFGNFRNDQSLSQEQIELVTKWVDGGIRRGNNPGMLPKPPNFTADCHSDFQHDGRAHQRHRHARSRDGPRRPVPPSRSRPASRFRSWRSCPAVTWNRCSGCTATTRAMPPFPAADAAAPSRRHGHPRRAARRRPRADPCLDAVPDETFRNSSGSAPYCRS